MRRRAQGLTDKVAPAAVRDFQAGLTDTYDGTPPELVVYGSCDRDEATENSDLDLFLIYSRPVNASL